MSGHIRISPSILNADRNDLDHEVARIAHSADWLHLDIMDSKFVPAFTFNFDESTRIVQNSPLPVDAHLMISNPDDAAVEYARIGAKSVTFHYEASSRPRETLRAIRAAGARSAIGIKPATPVEVLFDLLDEVDMFLVMTVEPGAGGQKFMHEMLSKVQALRDLVSSKKGSQWIQVDGGITLETISEAVRSGADTFVAGSVVYKSDDPGVMVDTLRRVAEESLAR